MTPRSLRSHTYDKNATVVTTVSKAVQSRGDFRGMGCSSCHVPYGNEGLYEGADISISKTETGHPLTHQIQGTRDADVTIHEVTYHGLAVETCTTCHNRGKRIGVSFQGLMETPYASPLDENAQDQPGLHTKHYYRNGAGHPLPEGHEMPGLPHFYRCTRRRISRSNKSCSGAN